MVATLITPGNGCENNGQPNHGNTQKPTLRDNHPGYESHVNDDQTCYYDPDREESLCGVTPSPTEGDVELPDGSMVGVSSANGTYANVEVGRLLVRAKTSINEILPLYNGKIIWEDEGLYLIELDLNKVSLKNLESDIRTENQNIYSPLTDISFSSVNTAKTIAAFMELGSRHKDIIEGVSLNNLGELTGSSTPINPEAINTVEQSNEVSSQNSWWLKEAKIPSAWRYSLGYGVKVGIVDDAWFKQLNVNDGNYKNDDFEGRIIEKYNLKETSYSDDYTLNGVHGTKVMALLGSQIDNEYGIAGVAPRTDIVAIQGWYEIEWIKGIKYAISKGCKVINLSQRRTWNRYDSLFISCLNQDCTQKQLICEGTSPYEWCTINGYNGLMRLEWERVFNYALTNDVIIVHGAGNDRESGFHIFPQYASHMYKVDYGIDPTINVGALLKKSEYEHCNVAPPSYTYTCTRANPPYNSNEIDLFEESNFGDVVDIYAPGRDIKTIYANNKWFKFGATSAATPIVAGVVALMKSRNPALTVTDIHNILKSTGKQDITIHIPTIDEQYFLLNHIIKYTWQQVQTKNVYMLNAVGAVGDNRVGAPLANIITGTLNNGTLQTPQSNYQLTPSYISNIYQDLNNKYVEVLGWQSGNSIEVLQIRETTAPSPSPTPTISPTSGLDEIVTNTNWIWFKNNVRTPTVIVPYYDSKVTIPNANDGRKVRAIWSEITTVDNPYINGVYVGPGRAVCGDCTYDF